MKLVATAAIASASLILTIPASLEANASRYNIRVNPVSDGVFEVIPGTGNGILFWCGAADYAHRVLRAPWNANLRITRGLGPSETTGRRSAVQFTTDANLTADTRAGGYKSVNSLQSGDTMRIQKAFDYCFEPFGRP